MDKGVWQEAVRENAYMKVVRSYYRYEGRVCAEKREDVSIVKRRERRSTRVYKRTVKKEVH